MGFTHIPIPHRKSMTFPGQQGGEKGQSAVHWNRCQKPRDPKKHVWMDAGFAVDLHTGMDFFFCGKCICTIHWVFGDEILLHQIYTSPGFLMIFLPSFLLTKPNNTPSSQSPRHYHAEIDIDFDPGETASVCGDQTRNRVALGSTKNPGTKKPTVCDMANTTNPHDRPEFPGVLP